MSSMRLALWALLAGPLLTLSTAGAQEPDGGSNKRFEIARDSGAGVVIDGVLDEAVWSRASAMKPVVLIPTTTISSTSVKPARPHRALCPALRQRGGPDHGERAAPG